ncbi:MAG: HIT family protein [Candidatus Cyclobacteriaceae bacterium M2_1C_046]
MENCIFCEIINKNAPATIIDEDEYTLTFFDIKPLFPGHCLIVPKQHIVTLPELPDDQVQYFFLKVRQVSEALPKVLDAQGTFVAMNNIVSQSVPHLHAHVVPRKKGDGLKGFFWPRKGYRNEEHKQLTAKAIIKALDQL